MFSSLDGAGQHASTAATLLSPPRRPLSHKHCLSFTAASKIPGMVGQRENGRPEPPQRSSAPISANTGVEAMPRARLHSK